ncbi:CBS domain-containing protein [uncultured Enterovirga sp.]|uniref:CBS domain-containing protein n=1 Tax=uncultured Enterovirga sp. TaxID=2026352 RepID=UPI0035CA2D10
MSVEHILAEKGRDTVTITPDKTLADVVDMLSRHRIGAVVVVDGDRTVRGILSERDVVKALAESGAEALAEPVSRRMSTEVATCSATDAVPALMAVMTEGKFRHIPVVEGGRLGGMVSIGDLVKHRLAEMEAEHKALRDYIATA